MTGFVITFEGGIPAGATREEGLGKAMTLFPESRYQSQNVGKDVNFVNMVAATRGPSGPSGGIC
jgi:hypothetical protein